MCVYLPLTWPGAVQGHFSCKFMVLNARSAQWLKPSRMG